MVRSFWLHNHGVTGPPALSCDGVVGSGGVEGGGDGDEGDAVRVVAVVLVEVVLWRLKKEEELIMNTFFSTSSKIMRRITR